MENLRRLADLIVASQRSRDAADGLADSLLVTPNISSDAAAAALRPFAGLPLTRAFAVQLVQRLRDEDPETTPTLLWLDDRLRSQDTNADDIVREEHRRQVAANVTVRNIITSMRFISELDWAEFFESVSLVDPILSQDPAGCYAGMDFATRDRYRHEIERIAKRSRSRTSELDIARRAIQLSTAARPDDFRRRHVGYYLSGEGLNTSLPCATRHAGPR